MFCTEERWRLVEFFARLRFCTYSRRERNVENLPPLWKCTKTQCAYVCVAALAVMYFCTLFATASGSICTSKERMHTRSTRIVAIVLGCFADKTVFIAHRIDHLLKSNRCIDN